MAEWLAFLKKYDGSEGRWKSMMRPMDSEDDYISAEKQFQNQKQHEQLMRQEVTGAVPEGRTAATATPLTCAQVQHILDRDVGRGKSTALCVY